MTALTKIACALLMTTGLAAPVLAAPGDAGSGPTMDSTPKNDAGSGPTKGANSNPTIGATSGRTSNDQSSMNGQSGMNGQNGQGAMNGQSAMNAKPGSMKISKRLQSDLIKADFTDIKIMPSSFLVQAKDSQGNRWS